MATSIAKPFVYYECSLEDVCDWRGRPRGHCITWVPEYRSLSLEELRFNDIRQPHYVPTVHANAPFLAPVSPSAPDSIRGNVRKNIYRSSIITFRVGSVEPQDFFVHEGIVATASGFVALALKHDWKESQQRVIPLPDDEPEVFDIYQQWLYEREIFSATFAEPPTDREEHRMLIDAYIFGDKLLDVHFKDAVIDKIIDRLRKTKLLDLSLVKIIYSKTPLSSPLRRVLLDIYGGAGIRDWVEKVQIDDLAQAEFMKDLLKLQGSEGQQSSVAKLGASLGNTCLYHEHVDGTCYKTPMGFTKAPVPSTWPTSFETSPKAT